MAPNTNRKLREREPGRRRNGARGDEDGVMGPCGPPKKSPSSSSAPHLLPSNPLRLHHPANLLPHLLRFCKHIPQILSTYHNIFPLQFQARKILLERFISIGISCDANAVVCECGSADARLCLGLWLCLWWVWGAKGEEMKG